MNKKAVKTSGELPETEDESIIDPDFEEVDEKDVQVNLSYIDRVNDFIARNELLEANTVYYLYKFDNPNGTTDSKSFISKYTDIDPPDEDSIGKTFGSGRYLVVMAVSRTEKAPKGYIKAYRIRIHSHYDNLKAERFPVQVQQAVPQTNNFNDTLEILGKLVALLSPLFVQRQQQSPDMSSMLFKMYESTGEVLKKNMIENVKVASELQRKLIQAENGEDMQTDTEEDEGISLIEQLKPLMIEWLPKLIGNNPQSKAIQQVVKTTPQFKQIIKNKADFKKLVSFLDQEKGKDTTDKILLNLQLKRV